MATSMRSSTARPRAWVLLGLGAWVGCRVAPAEAPPPDAVAWLGQGSARGELDAEPEDADAGQAPRARPPRSIFRDELERATAPGPAYLLRQLGPEPLRHQGRFVGWEITQLFPEDPALCAPGRCDLAVGDVILGVNGHRLATPQDLSDALRALPAWTALHVQSLRNGQRRQVTYAVIDDPA
jgi:hypothetical protein